MKKTYAMFKPGLMLLMVAAVAALMQGDHEARQTLIEHNLRLVVYIARRFENTGVNLEFIMPPQANAAEQFQVMVLSDDHPDVVSNAHLMYTGGGDKAISDKLDAYREAQADKIRKTVI